MAFGHTISDDSRRAAFVLVAAILLYGWAAHFGAWRARSAGHTLGRGRTTSLTREASNVIGCVGAVVAVGGLFAVMSAVPTVAQPFDPDQLTWEQKLAAVEFGHKVHLDDLPAFEALTKRFRFLLDSLQADISTGTPFDRRGLAAHLYNNRQRLLDKTGREISMLVFGSSVRDMLHVQFLNGGGKATEKDVLSTFALVYITCEDRPSDCE